MLSGDDEVVCQAYKVAHRPYTMRMRAYEVARRPERVKMLVFIKVY